MQLPFFVYGTLRAGQCNSHLLSGASAHWPGAHLSGAQLFDLGAYPMIIESDGGEVWGELVQIESAQYASVLRSLDRLEGVNSAQPENLDALYRRLPRAVSVEGEIVQAWVYFGREMVARRGRLVEGGDWLERFRAACP